MADEAERFPVELEVPVAWGDMDSLGHVNNTVYFRWFESARIAYFDQLEIAHDSHTAGLVSILARATCNFRIPLTFPDTITIRARVHKIGNTSLTIEYRITSAAHDHKVAAEGDGVVVLIDRSTGRSTAILPELRRRIEGLEVPSFSK
jgi:acyl-CoA thioester hydrolase